MSIPDVPDEFKLPPAWSAYLPVVSTMFRAVLIGAGMVGFTWAKTVTGDQVTMFSFAALTVAAALWSGWKKIEAIRDARRLALAAGMASAQATHEAGMPTVVVPR